ncbi:MAG: PAS domain S-box protein [Verrucomicrobia bacterium]|nr:PAS domain S-box protein [Verrucomicrobiota bacterium]
MTGATVQIQTGERRLLAGLGAAWVLLAVSAYFSYLNASHLIATSHAVARSYALMTREEELLARLTEAESSHFGYLVSGQEVFLEPYVAATNRISQLARELGELSRDAPVQQQRVRALEPLITRRLALIQERVETRRKSGSAAAAALVREREGKRVMDQIRRLLAAMTAAEEERLRTRERASTDRARITIWFDVGFGAFSVALLTGISFLLFLENVRRQQTEASLRRARDELEVRVRERTATLAATNNALAAQIAKHQQSERSLRDSEERLRAIVDTAAEGVITIDERGVIESVNAAGEKMFGYTAAELIGRNVSRLMPSPYREAHDRYLADYLRTGQARVIGVGREVVGQRKDGTVFPMDLSVGCAQLAGRRLFTGVLRDITARKGAEEQLGAMARSLAEKNKELETIVYVASHDLRSPLVNIQGFSNELARLCRQLRASLAGPPPGGSGDPRAVRFWLEQEMPEAIGYIQAGVAKMDVLLSGFLRFSRLGRAALTLERINAGAMLAGIARAMEFQVQQAGAKLEIGPVPDCLGDAAQLTQVFSNLLDNALKYLEPSRPGHITVTGGSEAGRVLYVVRDNGIGIAPEHQGKIFEIFHRLNPSAGEGEGLGLTIAQRILERQNGKIWVESGLGQGSAFFVSLPSPLQIDDRR